MNARLGGFFLFVCLLTPGAVAQSWAVGVKGGWGLLDPVRDSLTFRDATDPYLVGPYVEFGASWLRLEVDALYTQFKYQQPRFPEVTRHSWEFPIMGKVRIPFQGVKPFAVIGPTFRTLPDEFITNDSPKVGVTGGVGIDFKIGLVQVTPEMRYVRWTGTAGLGGAFANALETRRDQFRLMLGLGFGRR
jgi:hypothetical protein